MEPIKGLLNGLGVCALSGMLVGMIAGMLLVLLALSDHPPPPSVRVDTVVYSGLMIGAFGFAVLVFVLAVLGRFTLRSIAVPALTNSIVTSIVTTAAVSVSGAWKYAVWIGLVIGVLVGQALCKAAQTVIDRRQTR